jgi:hypothetical protein
LWHFLAVTYVAGAVRTEAALNVLLGLAGPTGLAELGPAITTVESGRIRPIDRVKASLFTTFTSCAFGAPSRR